MIACEFLIESIAFALGRILGRWAGSGGLAAGESRPEITAPTRFT